MTFEQTLAQIDGLIAARVVCYFITANLNYAMLCEGNEQLARLNAEAAFLVADGMPLVWASRFTNRRIPERVAGADLVVAMCERGARNGLRIYILGGPEGQAEVAGKMLVERFPGLILAGTDCPPFRNRTADEERVILDRIRVARPDVLFVAFGQPKGELWIQQHYRDLGVPVSVQIGGSFDFVTGRLKRAPQWMRTTGLEWVYRFLQEPRRLGIRYAQNIAFVWRMTLGSLFSRRLGLRNRKRARFTSAP